MLALMDIKQYIASIGITREENIYIGKMDGKKQKSIGVYSRPSSGVPNIAIGGLECTTYSIKPISLLIHWTKSKDETEQAANQLYETLLNTAITHIGNTPIHYIRLMVPEPQDIGTDDSGVYEYVIWLDFIYERNR